MSEGEVESIETEIVEGRETWRDGGRENESKCERGQSERGQSMSSASKRAYARGISERQGFLKKKTDAIIYLSFAVVVRCMK